MLYFSREIPDQVRDGGEVGSLGLRAWIEIVRMRRKIKAQKKTASESNTVFFMGNILWVSRQLERQERRRRECAKESPPPCTFNITHKENRRNYKAIKPSTTA